MNLTGSSRLFEQAFDTFKAFDELTVASSSHEQQAFPAVFGKFYNICLFGKRIS